MPQEFEIEHVWGTRQSYVATGADSVPARIDAVFERIALGPNDTP